MKRDEPIKILALMIAINGFFIWMVHQMLPYTGLGIILDGPIQLLILGVSSSVGANYIIKQNVLKKKIWIGAGSVLSNLLLVLYFHPQDSGESSIILFFKLIAGIN